MELQRDTVKKSNTQSMAKFGTDFWNDSCSLTELADAVQQGAVGATSNPVIVSTVLQEDQATWTPVLKKILKDNPTATEDEITWLLIEEVTRQAAALLKPVYERTKTQKGYLSAQTDARYFRSAEKMFKQGMHLAGLAKNIAVKVPTTAAGVEAMENLAAEGVRINATVCYTVPQALSVAEAMERAKGRMKSKNIHFEPYITLMVGRLDDHLKRVADSQKLDIPTEHLDKAGILVAKKSYQIFKERNYSSRLLIAAFRNEAQWRDLVGPGVIQTIPYKWWQKFNKAEPLKGESIQQAGSTEVLNQLLEKLPDFRRAYSEDGLSSTEFATYGASQHTLAQFMGGYQSLVESVRKTMLA